MNSVERLQQAPKNSPKEMKIYLQSKFGGWLENSPERLKSFAKLLGQEKEADGGRNAAAVIMEEVYSRRSEIPESVSVGELRLIDLDKFLFSTDLNPPIDNQVRHDDMNAPLSHYFIYTSLNSFLIRNTVLDQFSDGPIIEALKRGVRVVELDLLPNGREGICVATDKWFKAMRDTLDLQTCLNSIRQNAFTDTLKYPVILTFKDNLKSELQSRAIQMINDTFGNMVYHHDPNTSEELPSPAILANKVIITRRPPKKILFATNAVIRERDENIPSGLIENYQSLIAFHAVEPNDNLLKALTKDNAKNIQRRGPYEEDVIRYTREKFLRTRFEKIKGSRKPYRGLMYGAQMIALREQEFNRARWLIQGMFRANGGCGYVKKPDFLLNADPTNGGLYKVKDPKKTLKVKVYMGDGWGEDRKKWHVAPSLYVRVSVAGVPHDERFMNTKVNISRWTPEWEEEKFSFPLTYPELALLSIEVYHMSIVEEFAGQTCLPVSELKEGTRAVPLYDKEGKRYGSTMLLMRFKMELA